MKRQTKQPLSANHEKKKRIQKGGGLSKEEAEDLIAQYDVRAQIEGESREGRARTGVSKRGKGHCRLCRETGHNSRNCKKEVVEGSD